MWRGDSQRIGWNERAIEIATLQDGTNLAAPCTDCHRGNNVFNISPDDPTWARVLGRDAERPRPPGFTTRVESSTDTRGTRPGSGGPGSVEVRFRYIPVAQPDWRNDYNPSSECAACHESPGGGFRTPMPMGPACATLMDGRLNDASCYR